MKRFFLIWIFLFLSAPLWAQWKNIQHGFDYRVSENHQIHFFRIHPKELKIDLLLASDYGSSSFTAKNYREKSGTLLVINGGFFDSNYHSLGLLEKDGKLRNPLRETSWGIFFLGGKDGRSPFIISKNDWRPNPSQGEMFQKVTVALQVGPRLVINGSLPSFKDTELARRSAIGITPEGWLEIAASELPLTLHDWALMLSKDCPQALNLDGGSSTQISVQSGNFSLEIGGATAVPNALSVFEK